jgi:hypothetical protein
MRHRGEYMGRLKREAVWLLGSGIGATVFCWLAPEYGFSPVPFFTAVAYLLTVIARIVLRALSPHRN